MNYLLAFLNLYHLFIFETQSILEFRDQTGKIHFWPCPPKKICVNLYQHAKNQFFPSVHSSHKVYSRVPSSDLAHPFLAALKIFNHLYICVNLYQQAKNQLITSVHFWDTVNFRVQRPDWPNHILTMPNQKKFSTSFSFVNLSQHAKNEAVSLICSEAIDDLKILQSDGMTVLWCKSQRQDFPKYWICEGTQQIIRIFIVEQNQYELMTEFFNKFKNPCFWSIFGLFSQFWGKIRLCQAQPRMGF